jgi:DNA polymerase-1
VPALSAALLWERPLVALAPCRTAEGDAVVVVAGGAGGDDEELVIPLDAAGRGLVQRTLRRRDHVVAFADARPVLRWLLARGIDVARPICGATLDVLGGVAAEPGSAPPVSTSASAAAALARATLASLGSRIDRVEQRGQRRVARLESLVLRAFAALEHRGLPIARDEWRALVDEERRAAHAARERVFELAGPHVDRDLFGVPALNLDAEQEVRALLHRALGRPLDDTSRATLAAAGHPLADAIIVWRESQKIVTTWGEAFLDHVADVDGQGIGRLRSTFVPLGASTGRVACREPNLQNLPKDPRFHAALRAPAGRVLVTADYGTCELRIVAEFAEDPVFLAAFARGEDLHSTVASSMFGVPVSKTQNPELRQRAKAINFGLVYGMGAAALSSSLGVDRATGEELLARYFQTFPRIRSYLEGSVDSALRRGYSETLLGRRLFFDPADLDGGNARGELSRIMKNMPIQGTSADMTKLAMVRLHERLTTSFRGSAGLVNTIHDELVVECAAADGEAVAAVVQEEMAEAHRTLLRKVPPLVEVHVGPVWAH